MFLKYTDLPDRKNILALIVIVVYVLLNNFLIVNESYWLMVLPVFAVAFWYIIFKPDQTILLIALLTPISVAYTFEDADLTLNLPNEPLIIGMMVIFYLDLLIKRKYDRKVINHPITLAIIFYLFWILITASTSTMKVVSFKFFLSRFWFVTVFYFMTVILFKNLAFIKKYIWFFTSTLIIVVLYTLYVHSKNFFTQITADPASYPFMKGHTIYAAILAMAYPAMIGFAFFSKTLGLSRVQKILAYIFVFILTVGLILSYTRAAWISLMVAALFLLILWMRIRFIYLVVTLLTMTMVIYFSWSKIYTKLTSHEQKISSSNFDEHLKSITNITTDLSNTERLNRWSCAVRMFKQKPYFGWGPGTYMFKYAPFQLSKERTFISTDFGDLGNSHSEYLGPLCESGVLGLVSFLFILFFSVSKGMQIFYRSNDKIIKLYTLFALLGLITYYSHGLLNNYLDSDKASVFFWGFIAVITAFDIYYKNPEPLTNES